MSLFWNVSQPHKAGISFADEAIKRLLKKCSQKNNKLYNYWQCRDNKDLGTRLSHPGPFGRPLKYIIHDDQVAELEPEQASCICQALKLLRIN